MVAITRAEVQAKETAELIEKMGGRSYIIPLFDFNMPEDLSPIREFVEALRGGNVDYTIFMSVNAVRFLFKEVEILNSTVHLYNGLKKTAIMAVGPKTAEELARHGIHVDLIPSEYSSEGIAQALKGHNLRGKRVFILRVRGANPTLRNELESMGALVREIHVYEQRALMDYGMVRAFIENLVSGKIDAIVFGSSQSVKNFKRVIEEVLSPEGLREAIERLVIVAIGPETAKALRDSKLRIDVVPEAYTFRDALIALAHYFEVTNVKARGFFE